MLDKLAVLRGGGKYHCVGLYDMILIKDNHIDFAGSIEEAVDAHTLQIAKSRLKSRPERWNDVRVAA